MCWCIEIYAKECIHFDSCVFFLYLYTYTLFEVWTNAGTNELNRFSIMQKRRVKKISNAVDSNFFFIFLFLFSLHRVIHNRKVHQLKFLSGTHNGNGIKCFTHVCSHKMRLAKLPIINKLSEMDGCVRWNGYRRKKTEWDYPTNECMKVDCTNDG